MIKFVEKEIGQSNPNTSFLLEAHVLSDPPEDEHLNELIRQLNFVPDKQSEPTITWQKEGKLAVEYHPDQNQPDEWVGNVAKDVFRGVKHKAMCHKFFWTPHEM